MDNPLRASSSLVRKCTCIVVASSLDTFVIDGESSTAVWNAVVFSPIPSECLNPVVDTACYCDPRLPSASRVAGTGRLQAWTAGVVIWSDGLPGLSLLLDTSPKRTPSPSEDESPVSGPPAPGLSPPAPGLSPPAWRPPDTTTPRRAPRLPQGGQEQGRCGQTQCDHDDPSRPLLSPPSSPATPHSSRHVQPVHRPTLLLSVALLVLQLLATPTLASRTPSAEMLSVGNLTTSNATSATSPPAFHTSPLLANYSLDVPQGDQPIPPLREGTPKQPIHWGQSTNRTHYVQSRYGLYLEMWPDGQVHTVNERTPFCIFVLLSHLTHIVMKGFVSDKYLCMNSTTSQLYTLSAKSGSVNPDCYMNETMRSGYRVYLFHNCRHGNDKRCYLGHYRNGTMRLGRNARKSQETAQWLTTPPGEDLAEAEKRKDEIHKGVAWTPPPPPPPSPTPKPVDKREQKRKRVRRWCRNLTVILKHPEKFRNRCEYDCDILEKMIQRPERHMRRCLHRQIVRRKRKKARKLGETLDIKKVKAKARARVKILWPKRDEIFRRLRQLRRCNKRRKAKQRKGSCTPKDLRRAQRRRAQRRRVACRHGKSSRCQGSRSSEVRSKPRSGASSSSRHRIRHHHKETRGNQRNGRMDEQTVAPSVHVDPESKLLTALTRR